MNCNLTIGGKTKGCADDGVDCEQPIPSNEEMKWKGRAVMTTTMIIIIIITSQPPSINQSIQ